MINSHTVAAIIVAAGSSTRMGFDKLIVEINEKPVVRHSVDAFDKCDFIDEIVVVVGKNEQDIRTALIGVHKPIKIVKGGSQRFESVVNGLMQTNAQYVAIHDAARPFVSKEVIANAINAALKTGAAAPAVQVKDTIKIARENGEVISTPDRESLYAVQTPQCFCTQEYKQLLKTVSLKGVTDDCSVYERANKKVTLTMGDYANIKITTKEDILPFKENKTMQNMRIGHGYDVHKLVENRKLILGGVTIPHEKGLLGHSDADVLVHAIMDGLLGAAAMGDIGKLFPDNDSAYEGADSIELLKKVCCVLNEKGYTVSNVDSTLLCQAPKLAPHINEMRQNLANAMGISVDNVSVKATTEEGLGFTGEKLGIAAHSVCLLWAKN